MLRSNRSGGCCTGFGPLRKATHGALALLKPTWNVDPAGKAPKPSPNSVPRDDANAPFSADEKRATLGLRTFPLALPGATCGDQSQAGWEGPRENLFTPP